MDVRENRDLCQHPLSLHDRCPTVQRVPERFPLQSQCERDLLLAQSAGLTDEFAQSHDLVVTTAQWGHLMCGPASVLRLLAAEHNSPDLSCLGWVIGAQRVWSGEYSIPLYVRPYPGSPTLRYADPSLLGISTAPLIDSLRIGLFSPGVSRWPGGPSCALLFCSCRCGARM